MGGVGLLRLSPTAPAMKVTRHPLFAPRDQLAQRVPADAGMIAKLDASFALLTADPDWAARFYETLFRQNPSLRTLFPADMAAQRRKLHDSLAMVVAHLREPDAVRARLLDLGRAHVAYGARPEHYPVVVGAMVSAMAEAGGERWSDDLTTEWTSALNMIAAIMREGAAGAPPPGGAA